MDHSRRPNIGQQNHRRKRKRGNTTTARQTATERPPNKKNSSTKETSRAALEARAAKRSSTTNKQDRASISKEEPTAKRETQQNPASGTEHRRTATEAPGKMDQQQNRWRGRASNEGGEAAKVATIPTAAQHHSKRQPQQSRTNNSIRQQTANAPTAGSSGYTSQTEDHPQPRTTPEGSATTGHERNKSTTLESPSPGPASPGNKINRKDRAATRSNRESRKPATANHLAKPTHNHHRIKHRGLKPAEPNQKPP